MLNPLEIVASFTRVSRRYSSTHNGIDIACVVGTPVKARRAGKVTRNGTNPVGKDFGNYCIVDYGNGIQGWYAHLDRFNQGVGARVNAGDVIAFSGNTGLSTGPHLHYSESKTGTTVWIDPDTTQGGGEDMVNQDLLNAFFLDLLGRNPDTGANATYIGQPALNVYHAIRTSPERATKVARDAEELQAAKDQAAKVPALELSVGQLTGQVTDIQNQINVLEQQVVAKDKEIARLEKKIASMTPTAPSEASFTHVIEVIRTFIVKWLNKEVK